MAKAKNARKVKAAASRDPRAPRRPLTAFMAFTREQRDTVAAENTSFTVEQIANALFKRWKRSSDKEQLRYQELAVLDKERYISEMGVFDATPSSVPKSDDSTSSVIVETPQASPAASSSRRKTSKKNVATKLTGTPVLSAMPKKVGPSSAKVRVTPDKLKQNMNEEGEEKETSGNKSNDQNRMDVLLAVVPNATGTSSMTA